MKIKNHRDFWAGLIFLACGAGFAIAAIAYPLGEGAQPGSGYFPLLLGLLLVLLGCIVLFKALTIETEDGAPIGPVAWRPLLAVIAAIVAFAVGLPTLGLLPTIPLLTLATSLALDAFSLRGWLARSAWLTGLAWLLLVAGLHLPIPLIRGLPA